MINSRTSGETGEPVWDWYQEHQKYLARRLMVDKNIELLRKRPAKVKDHLPNDLFEI